MQNCACVFDASQADAIESGQGDRARDEFLIRRSCQSPPASQTAPPTQPANRIDMTMLDHLKDTGSGNTLVGVTSVLAPAAAKSGGTVTTISCFSGWINGSTKTMANSRRQ